MERTQANTESTDVEFDVSDLQFVLVRLLFPGGFEHFSERNSRHLFPNETEINFLCD